MLGHSRPKKIEYHFGILKELANKLAIEEKKGLTFLLKLFHRRSEQDKISENIMGLIIEFQARSNFPALSFADENALLKKLASLYKNIIHVAAIKLQHDKQFDKAFAAFFSLIHNCIKSLMHEFFPVKDINELNINYLEELVACRETGMAYPTRFNLLKQEALDVLNCYTKPSSPSKPNTLLQTAIETLKNDKIGINSCAESHAEKFINLLKWLDLFRQMLINQEERILLLPITRAIDRALGIIRPDSHRTLELQRSLLADYDLIQMEINFLEKTKHDIDSKNKGSVVKVGVFSRSDGSPVNDKAPTNNFVLGLTRSF